MVQVNIYNYGINPTLFNEVWVLNSHLIMTVIKKKVSAIIILYIAADPSTHAVDLSASSVPKRSSCMQPHHKAKPYNLVYCWIPDLEEQEW